MRSTNSSSPIGDYIQQLSQDMDEAKARDLAKECVAEVDKLAKAGRLVKGNKNETLVVVRQSLGSGDAECRAKTVKIQGKDCRGLSLDQISLCLAFLVAAGLLEKTTIVIKYSYDNRTNEDSPVFVEMCKMLANEMVGSVLMSNIPRLLAWNSYIAFADQIRIERNAEFIGAEHIGVETMAVAGEEQHRQDEMKRVKDSTKENIGRMVGSNLTAGMKKIAGASIFQATTALIAHLWRAISGSK